MQLVCPLCNGIDEAHFNCPLCHSNMVDEGPVVDYLDDYSPYLSKDITQLVDGAAHDKCVHLYKCKHCGYDKIVEINRVMM